MVLKIYNIAQYQKMVYYSNRARQSQGGLSYLFDPELQCVVRLLVMLDEHFLSLKPY